MTMRVRFLRGTALGGVGNDAAPGDQRDLPDVQAAALVASGRAVVAGVPAAAVAVAPAPTIATPADAPKPIRRKAK